MTTQQYVNANPTKDFFKSMLIRDIELKDAILDLLDNCIDGVRRKTHGVELEKPELPYYGYWANLNIQNDTFIIEDNCGGIPLDIAKDYAFRFGRADKERDSDIETVGMYGIGMKRAIFKIGTAAVITTKPTEELCYKISIPEDWHEQTEWEFPVDFLDTKTLPHSGTNIEINPIHKEVQDEFDLVNSNFIDNLSKIISTHYAYIIQKGFNILINNKEIKPTLLKLVLTDNINPFVYEAQMDDMKVQLIVGFRATDQDNYFIPSEELEEQEQQQSVDNNSDDAGWTIICNDRVVLLNDKTYITGWGVGSIPKYHTQFIRISGVVEFHSNNANNLPLTTTKRSVDLNSELYNSVKNIMMEGMKIFTNYTNHWKKQKDDEQINHINKSFHTTREFVDKILRDDFEKNKGQITNPKAINKIANIDDKKFKPSLPQPTKGISYKNIRFTKLENDIKEVAKFIYGTEDVAASEVGVACFDRVLAEARE